MGGKLVRRRIRIYQFTMRRRPAGRRSQTDASGVRHGRIFRKVTAVTYDAGGNQLTVRDPNNVVADMVYDSLGRNTQRTVTFGDVSLTETRSSGRHYRNDNLLSGISYSNTNIGNLGYSWDATGNKTAETIGGVMSGYGFTSAGTAYDDEDRLTGYQRAATSGSALLAQSWALTSVGDWSSVTTNGTAVTRTHGPTHELLNLRWPERNNRRQGKSNSSSLQPHVSSLKPVPHLGF